MKRSCLLLVTAFLTASLFGDDYFNCLTNLAYAAVRTNATLLVGQQASANSNNLAGTILQSSVESSFDISGTLTNSLRRLLGTGTATTASTAAITTTTTVTNAPMTQPTVYRHATRPQHFQPSYRRQPIRRKPSGF